MTKALPPILCLIFAVGPAFAGAPLQPEGPLSPCVQGQAEANSGAAAAEPAYAWGVEIATSFSKQDALDQFARAKQEHAAILADYQPILVEACDLHMGTDLQYSARVGMDSRDAADGLCAKLLEDGGACIVQKN